MHRRFELPQPEVDGTYNKFTDLINGKIWTLLVMLFVVFVITSKNISVVKFGMYFLYLLIFTLCISSNLKIIFRAVFFILPVIMFLAVMFIPYYVRLNCNESHLLDDICIHKVTGEHFLQIVMKVFLSTFSLVIYVNSLTKASIIESLQWLGVPKIVTKITAVTLLYFEILKWEVERIKLAMKFRLFSKKGFLVYWKLITFCIGMLFLHSYKRITYLYYSLKLRGYDGIIYDYSRMPISIIDFLFFSVMSCILFLIKVSSVVYY